MIAAVFYIDAPVAVFGHALQPDTVAVTGVGSVNDPKTVLRKPDHRKVGADTALVIQKMCVDAFADSRVARDLGHTGVFHERLGVITADVIHCKM